MAVMNTTQRAEVWKEAMETFSNQALVGNPQSIGITKTDLRAAVDAIDAWIDSNAISFNTSIPQPARSALTTKQKVWLFMLVLTKRFNIDI